MKKERIAVAAVWLMIAACFFGALWELAHRPMVHPGPVSKDAQDEWRETLFIFLAVAGLLLLVRHWLIRKLMRFFLVIAVVLALLAEPILHWWGIPHPEGLWLPYLEGGALVSAIVRYWQQIRMKVEKWLKAVVRRNRR